MTFDSIKKVTKKALLEELEFPKKIENSLKRKRNDWIQSEIKKLCEENSSEIFIGAYWTNIDFGRLINDINNQLILPKIHYYEDEEYFFSKEMGLPSFIKNDCLYVKARNYLLKEFKKNAKKIHHKIFTSFHISDRLVNYYGREITKAILEKFTQYLNDQELFEKDLKELESIIYRHTIEAFGFKNDIEIIDGSLLHDYTEDNLIYIYPNEEFKTFEDVEQYFLLNIEVKKFIKENLKNIPRFGGLYKINKENGEFFNFHGMRVETFMKKFKKGDTLFISLTNRHGTRKEYKVAKLVAETYPQIVHRPSIEYSVIRHKDEDTMNVSPTNLYYSLPKKYIPKPKKKKHKREKNIYQYDLYVPNLIKVYRSAKEAVESNPKLKLNPSAISRCCRANGLSKSHKGYRWSFKPING